MASTLAEKEMPIAEVDLMTERKESCCKFSQGYKDKLILGFQQGFMIHYQIGTDLSDSSRN